MEEGPLGAPGRAAGRWAPPPPPDSPGIPTRPPLPVEAATRPSAPGRAGAGHWLRGEAVLESRPPSLTTGLPEPRARRGVAWRGHRRGRGRGRRGRRAFQPLAARGVGPLLHEPAREARAVWVCR